MVDSLYEVTIHIFISDLINLNLLDNIGSFMGKILSEKLNSNMPTELVQIFRSVQDPNDYLIKLLNSRKPYYSGSVELVETCV